MSYKWVEKSISCFSFVSCQRLSEEKRIERLAEKKGFKSFFSPGKIRIERNRTEITPPGLFVSVEFEGNSEAILRYDVIKFLEEI